MLRYPLAAVRASVHVDVRDLDCVVPVAETVPRRDVGLDVAGRVGRSCAEGVPADAGRLPVERPVLPVIWTLRRLELRGMPFSLAREADVDVRHRPAA